MVALQVAVKTCGRDVFVHILTALAGGQQMLGGDL